MKHLTFADKSMLVDDETADTLIEYAAILARNADADAVKVHTISSDGDVVLATLLLDAGAPIMAETSTSTFPGPDNAEALAYMRDRMTRLTAIGQAGPDDEIVQSFDDL